MVEGIELAHHFFAWAKADLLKEIRHGFPSLGKMRCARSIAAISALQEMAPDAREAASSALVKKRMLAAHPELASRIGRLTESEEMLCAACVPVVPWPPKMYVELLELQRASPGRFELDVDQLSGLLVERLPSVAGSLVPRRSSPCEWYFERSVGVWTIGTHVQPPRKNRGVMYYQSVINQSGDSFDGPISCLSWMGIASTTAWEFVEASTMSSVVKDLCLLCDAFTEAFEKWIA